MADDAITAFVVSLGLDPTDYNREMKKYRDDRKRLSEEDAKYNRQSNDGQKRQVEAMRSLRNETAGFLLTLAGASSVTTFFTDMVKGAADTGRLAQNLGMATERVGAWEAAIKRAGGTAENAQGALRLMSSLYQQNKLGVLDHGTQGDLRGLGVSQISQDPEENLFAISRAATRMDRQQFIARASRLGLDQGTINVLAEGPNKLRATLAEMEKLNATTAEQAEEARQLEVAWLDLQDTLKTLVRPAIYDAVTWLNDFAKALLALKKAWSWDGLTTVHSEGSSNPGPGKRADEGWGDWAVRKSKEWFTPQTGPEASNAGQLFRRGQRGASSTGGRAAGGGEGKGDRTSATVERYFRAKGYSAAQAKGIAAAVVAEGGLARRTGGGYQGRALGIGQLLGDRRTAFLKKYGAHFTLQNELDFMNWELRGGDRGGASVLRETTQEGVLHAMVKKFYRPAPGAETHGDLQRGMAHLTRPGALASARAARTTTTQAASTVNQTTHVGQIVINTEGKNADQIARDMRVALAKRGLTTQANTGLQP